MADEQCEEPHSPDIHFEPIVSLPLVEIKTLEENEDTLFKIRAKLYRYESAEDPPEWKERGTGEVKILKHKAEDYVRILMRRDKTLKICANHYVQPYMELKVNNSSDRAWVYSVLADFADEEPKPELLAIKFASTENAQKFKEAFDNARKIATEIAEKQKNSSLDKSDTFSESDSGDADESSEAHPSNDEDKDSKEITKGLSELKVTSDDKKTKTDSQDESSNHKDQEGKSE